ncbi:MAG: dihydropteroate synthase [Kiritimatiellaeota bacterium]|nr:dihydropteroate synthase [Kiritimatiellota bacterium]
MEKTFIVVGENIHCTRVRLTSGKFIIDTADGRKALAFKADGKPAALPIPQAVVEGEEFTGGKVRHVMVAAWQGMYGATEADKAAGIAYIQSLARQQEAEGASFLDVNVDEFSRTDATENVKAVKWVADIVQAACKLPLSIDSSNPLVLEAGLAACDTSRGKPLVNSVSLERAALVPVAAKGGACVIAGASGAERMPETTQERIDNLFKLAELLKANNIAIGDTFFDPLVMTISADGANGLKVIDSIRAVREHFGPAAHFAPGLSNVSYGLPKRPLINQVFARLCQDAGCDGGIVDPAQINAKILAGIDLTTEASKLAIALLKGEDDFGMEFITAVREEKI